MNCFVLVTVFFIALYAAPAFAVHPGEEGDSENIESLVEATETPEAGETEPRSLGHINEYLTVNGLVEVELYNEKPEGADDQADITLATVELSAELTLNEYIGGHLVLLYEEVEDAQDDFTVDELVLSLTLPKALFGQTPSLHFGRMYLPFGMFNSYMVSDPLTLELGETRDTAALLAFAGDLWTLKAAVFDGDTDTSGNNDGYDSWVAALELTPCDSIVLGASYISDLAESDIRLVQTERHYAEDVAGASAFLSARYDRFGLEIEYLAALEDFAAADLSSAEELTGERPTAWNLELAWMPTERLQLAARYEESTDFSDDVRRYGVAASYGFCDSAVISCEYLNAATRDVKDDPVHTVTARLALEF